MDKRNGNISDVFGNYNSAGEVKDVSSKMWEPISAGRSAASASQNNKGSASRKSADKKQSAKKMAEHDFISQGNPAGRKQAEKEKKTAPKASSDKKQSQKKKNPPSRTPKGRDLRRDVREERKDRKDRQKNSDDYNESIANAHNHDEASYLINEGKKKRRALRTGAKVFIAVFVAVICLGACFVFKGLPVESIIIVGETAYTQEEIQQASGVRVGKSMLLLSESGVRRALTKKLPYIKDVTLTRGYPSTITLTLEAASERYVISNASGSFILDSDKKVIAEGSGEAKAGLYFAEGFDFQSLEIGDTYKPEGVNAERFILLERFAELFEKSEIVKTAVIELQNTSDVRVVVGGKVRIYFGSCINLEEKIPYATAIIVKVLKAGQTGYLDMTTEVGYFKPGSMTM